MDMPPERVAFFILFLQTLGQRRKKLSRDRLEVQIGDLDGVGDDPTAYATKDMQHVYYCSTPKSAGTYSVWTANLEA